MKELITVFAIAVALSTSTVSNAAVITFTDRATWAAAVNGTLNLQDFNAEAVGSFDSRDFGDFSAAEVGGGLFSSIQPGSNSNNIDGTNFLQLQSSFSPGSVLRFTFDNPITALGFDYTSTDPTGDEFEIELPELGFQNTFGPDGTSGFFGLISTDAFSQADFSDTVGNGGFLGSGSLDNVEFSAGQVPEPASILVWSLVLLTGVAVVWMRRRRVVPVAG